jgi:hypothetical protein
MNTHSESTPPTTRSESAPIPYSEIPFCVVCEIHGDYSADAARKVRLFGFLVTMANGAKVEGIKCSTHLGDAIAYADEVAADLDTAILTIEVTVVTVPQPVSSALSQESLDWLIG